MTTHNSHGVIVHENSNRRTDFLYRISLKCLIFNNDNQVLVVKEAGCTYWDLPGGGMDHGEDLQSAIAREMHEEVNLKGNFTYKIIEVDEPAHLNAHNFWQLRLIFKVEPANMVFSAGEDSDEIAFIDANTFKTSEHEVERRIYKYASLII